MENNILVVSMAVLVFAVLARPIKGSPITMPMVFTTAGLVLGPHVLGVLNVDVENKVVSGLAEAALVVVLFTDASRIEAKSLVPEHGLALRLLLIGLPLAVAFGAVSAAWLLPSISVAGAGLVAVALAPTDAALGQSFVTEAIVPSRIRQTLNVESGLNDGLAVPFLTVFLDLAREDAGSILDYALLFLRLVGLGVAVGALTGWIGGRVLDWSLRQHWATDTTQRLATIALAVVAYSGAEAAGGNGFVAAFTGGLVVGTAARSLLPRTTAFAEAEGQLLTLLTFMLFGALVVADVVGHFEWQYLGYALVSLFVVRPLAVLLSLLDSGVKLATDAFVGWAGPRGLASIVYAVLIADSSGVPERRDVFLVAATTVIISIYSME